MFENNLSFGQYIWLKENGYFSTKITFPGGRRTVNLSRLLKMFQVCKSLRCAYCITPLLGHTYQVNRLIFQNNNFSSWKMLPKSEQWIKIQDDLECSHLCWEQKCLNMDHLIVESHQDNQERKKCANQGVCTGHQLYNCLT